MTYSEAGSPYCAEPSTFTLDHEPTVAERIEHCVRPLRGLSAEIDGMLDTQSASEPIIDAGWPVVSDARRFVLQAIPRGELRGLLLDLLSDVEMSVTSSPTALRDLKDHESAAEHRQEQDPNASAIVAACRLVSDLVSGVKRCPYCNRDTKQEPTRPGCTKFATHETERGVRS